MFVNPLIRPLAVAALLAVAAAPALAADGKQLFTDKGCVACHGEDANTPLDVGYPRLAGQNAEYAFTQMKDIKSGARANGLTAETMKPILDEVSEPEMRALADYLATLPRLAGTGPAGAGKKLYMTKTCVACHGKDGLKPVLKTYPAIGGQEKAYLLTQMKDIKSGARKNGATNAMQPVMHLVTEAEIEPIAEFLANVK
ncbi:c-type cytochrome [Magnetospirillum sp. UT-4]|uniref:c-type cytochrome n=1 Tax=Magnetospirillum sp. UT-4 TaxID=2681467 RepID=UPI00137CEBA6|nr:c-type cytochrome [Magnetospirillum sp. UT-4]CAA7626601.1 putative Cytochrome c4 [Magnetospirillum sp. UT-4]